MTQPFLIALQFLTCLPVTLAGMPTPRDSGRSLLFYPLVGLLIGSALCLFAWLLAEASPLLQAALVLALWVGLTGALHLDGLADTADAWVGGFGDRARTLAIMKDPRSGPVGVTALVLVLLLKFAALTTLLATPGSWWLVPVFGRAMLVLLLLHTPYVRAGGLGSTLVAELPKSRAAKVLLVTAIGLLWVGGASWLVVLLIGATVYFGLRARLCSRLGGTTGDTAGALLEVLETVALVTLAL